MSWCEVRAAQPRPLGCLLVLHSSMWFVTVGSKFLLGFY